MNHATKLTILCPPFAARTPFGGSLRRKAGRRLFEPFVKEPSRPARVEIGILNPREPLTEGLEGIPANRFGFPAGREVPPANCLHQVAEPGRHRNGRRDDIPYPQGSFVSEAEKTPAVG